jgi:hypothetical protein
MRTRTLGRISLLVLILALVGVSPFRSEAADAKKALAIGLSFEHFSRTISWDGKTSQSKAVGDLITARQTIELRPGLDLEFAAGLSLANFNGLVFRDLPVSIDYEAGPVSGLLLGGALRARVLEAGEFEIEGRASFVYSLGFAKTRPLEGFAVEGNVRARPSWFRVSAGPRISYRLSGRLVPYLSLTADWFSGSFTVNETLADLTGYERKKLQAKGFFEASLGAEYAFSERLSLRGEAGFLPYPGGVDGAASAGFLYRF